MASQSTNSRQGSRVDESNANHTDTDSSSDRFTDASEGRKRANSVSPSHSPIPTTRVERVDEEPSYGEVPGTKAYELRRQDAVPDEVEVVSRSRSGSRVDFDAKPLNSSPPIPLIIATKIDPEEPAYGDVPGTEAYEKRRADALPDVILKSPDGSEGSENPFKSGRASPTSHDRHPDPNESSFEIEDADDEQEDFDDFEEGQQADEDEEFGDFDTSIPTDTSTTTDSIDWSDIDGLDDLTDSLRPYLTQLFPYQDSDPLSPPPSQFLSDRSLSLYSQLVAPPPLAPPNWLRSRIRRLFLVSLGVPVDLDEILPASKQKKLILPSIHSPRASGEFTKSMGAVSRLKGQNDSSVSVDSSNSKGKGKKRREESLEPKFDMTEALRIGGTTESRLEGMEDDELKDHVQHLEILQGLGEEALEYWSKKKDGAIKEKEAFEGVIENLVKHMNTRKVRK